MAFQLVEYYQGYMRTPPLVSTLCRFRLGWVISVIERVMYKHGELLSVHVIMNVVLNLGLNARHGGAVSSRRGIKANWRGSIYGLVIVAASTKKHVALQATDLKSMCMWKRQHS